MVCHSEFRGIAGSEDVAMEVALAESRNKEEEGVVLVIEFSDLETW